MNSEGGSKEGLDETSDKSDTNQSVPNKSKQTSYNKDDGCPETTNDFNSKKSKFNQTSLEAKDTTVIIADTPAEHRRRSASRDSSLNNDDPKSLGNYSISAASGKQNWSIGKDLADGDDPSISSIKGDSISATIADYNRKHRAHGHSQQQMNDDHQSRISSAGARLICDPADETRTIDDLSSNVNFYVPGSSSSNSAGHYNNITTKPGDFMSVSSVANADAFDIIEESGNVSSSEDLDPQSNPSSKGNHSRCYNKKSTSSKGNKRYSSKYQRHQNHRQQQQQRQSSSSSSSSYLEQALEIDDLAQEAAYQIEPIVFRGNGNITLFGLSNSFSAEFPSALIGRVSRDEFDRTMKRINLLLKDQQSLSAKILLFGSLCCCCSLGFSLVWPSIALKKRSKSSLKKLLADENSRLYSKLGLNWKLGEQRCYSNHAFVEYVIMIEFTPKINLYLPD